MHFIPSQIPKRKNNVVVMLRAMIREQLPNKKRCVGLIHLHILSRLGGNNIVLLGGVHGFNLKRYSSTNKLFQIGHIR